MQASPFSACYIENWEKPGDEANCSVLLVQKCTKISMVLGRRSLEETSDLSRKLCHNWGVGGHSIVGAPSRGYGNILSEYTVIMICHHVATQHFIIFSKMYL